MHLHELSPFVVDAPRLELYVATLSTKNTDLAAKKLLLTPGYVRGKTATAPPPESTCSHGAPPADTSRDRHKLVFKPVKKTKSESAVQIIGVHVTWWLAGSTHRHACVMADSTIFVCIEAAATLSGSRTLILHIQQLCHAPHQLPPIAVFVCCYLPTSVTAFAWYIATSL
jgi:hypothetical protein